MSLSGLSPTRPDLPSNAVIDPVKVSDPALIQARTALFRSASGSPDEL